MYFSTGWFYYNFIQDYYSGQIETSLLICTIWFAKQLSGFYMIETFHMIEIVWSEHWPSTSSELTFSRAHILDLGYQFHYQFITILVEFIFMPSFLRLFTFQCSETQWVFCSKCFFAFHLFHKVTFNFQYFHIFFMSSVNSFSMHNIILGYCSLFFGQTLT